ncbi:peptidase M30, hyicolysin [Brachyspira sp. G79]|uniref:peptidase M30, hyicolysin n=1 Tax=Brachyspira sp. G79 TaxID=1358104 RepID=UPI000BBC0211|nr:peptidase M30, hyicolysin [Brachyspira sp. G79]PCG19083.1 peptidase M30, hyicolysin [Brachyspira sp. G79]
MNKYIILFIFSIVFLNSCGVVSSILGGDYNNAIYDDGVLTYYDEYSSSIKRFKVINENNMIETKTFRTYAESDNLIIYVENGANVQRSSVSKIGYSFNKYYSDLVNTYGNHTDVDGNGKINILLFSMNPAGASTVILGYFYPDDLILGNFNDAEILYMDVDLVNGIPDIMAGTILHELQHLINFNVNDINKGISMDLWLNEALSESTSILYSPTTVSSRIEEFNSMGGYYCFYTWYLPIAVFANYPSASVFMNWLYSASGNDKTVFRDIASSSQINGYDKVLSSVSHRGMASTWEELLLNWMEGIFSYQVSGVNPVFRRFGETVPLYPGALVAYYGSLGSISDNNLSTRKLNANIEIALNKDMYIGDSPSAINIQIPSSVNSMQYKSSSQSGKPYVPKYKNILFGKDGKIKEY